MVGSVDCGLLECSGSDDVFQVAIDPETFMPRRGCLPGRCFRGAIAALQRVKAALRHSGFFIKVVLPVPSRRLGVTRIAGGGSISKRGT